MQKKKFGKVPGVGHAVAQCRCSQIVASYTEGRGEKGKPVPEWLDNGYSVTLLSRDEFRQLLATTPVICQCRVPF